MPASVRRPYQIMIVDDHGVLRNGIKAMIAQEKGLSVCGEAADGDELFAYLQNKASQQPDLIILDLNMSRPAEIEGHHLDPSRFDGMAILDRICIDYSALSILIFTMFDKVECCFKAFEKGANGYLTKAEADIELFNAIAAVRAGRIYISPCLHEKIYDQRGGQTEQRTDADNQRARILAVHLTRREHEVLSLVIQGETSQQIADRFCLSRRTVDQHRANILKKFGVKSMKDLLHLLIMNNCAKDLARFC